MNMTKEFNLWIAERLVDLKAQQEAGKTLRCPRCGRYTMKEDLTTNALSRCANIYICDQCGTEEALRNFMKNPLQLHDWHCMRIDSAFVPETIRDYSPTIETHIPALEALYRRWLDEGKSDDFRAYRNAARRACTGLIQLWTHPFQIEYRAKDGTRALIRFREQDGKIQHTIDYFEK